MQNEDFVVAIPSYRRAEQQLTLELFEKAGLKKENLFIFVQTEEDYKEYTQRYSERANIILKYANGVAQARNNILKYFSGSRNILMCDDDIKRFGTSMELKIKEVSTEDIIPEINRCFVVNKKIGGSIFGIYPIYNDFFMSRTISTRVSINTVLGFPKGFNRLFDETYESKEDIELCARLLYNCEKVVRFNYLGVDAKHRNNDGGCKEVWASGINEIVSKRLEQQYRHIIEVNKSKPAEIRMVIKDKKIKI